ncbi:MAG: ATP-binding protein [Proteobacteria bacterium]|nr:MAG: ATP-binding protein [Pseudomonadota bacterium]
MHGSLKIYCQQIRRCEGKGGMKEIDHPPHAASLLESMRSIGYTLESAIADLIDNSISAFAKNICIEFRSDPQPYLAIIDDGRGMSIQTIVDAMRHGSTSPLAQREGGDLGRYGLGLKTASLSQCRRMTVVSKHNGAVNGFCWDLDVIASRQAWVMLELEPAELQGLPHYEDLMVLKSGTMVLMEKTDRLMAGEVNVESAFREKMGQVHHHLSLVFHRFLTKEGVNPKLHISINGGAVPSIDPFLQDHKATQRLDEELLAIDGTKVSVKPFILPHISKLSIEEVSLAGGNEGLRSQQGFYVYRNRRLIIWGTWFRLAKKDELSKLARVRVDIPNALDHLWTLDIKKSAAHPPEAVRKNLRRTIERIRNVSGRTISFKGRIASSAEFTPGWLEVTDRGGFRFEINKEHPVVRQFILSQTAEGNRLLNSFLDIIERSFPADALYSRMASDFKPEFNSDYTERKLEEAVRSLIQSTEAGSFARKSILASLHLIEPFNLHPLAVKKIAEEYMTDE